MHEGSRQFYSASMVNPHLVHIVKRNEGVRQFALRRVVLYALRDSKSGAASYVQTRGGVSEGSLPQTAVPELLKSTSKCLLGSANSINFGPKYAIRLFCVLRAQAAEKAGWPCFVVGSMCIIPERLVYPILHVP